MRSEDTFRTHRSAMSDQSGKAMFSYRLLLFCTVRRLPYRIKVPQTWAPGVRTSVSPPKALTTRTTSQVRPPGSRGEEVKGQASPHARRPLLCRHRSCFHRDRILILTYDLCRQRLLRSKVGSAAVFLWLLHTTEWVLSAGTDSPLSRGMCLPLLVRCGSTDRS